jgi:hypothetical protein
MRNFLGSALHLGFGRYLLASKYLPILSIVAVLTVLPFKNVCMFDWCNLASKQNLFKVIPLL